MTPRAGSAAAASSAKQIGPAVLHGRETRDHRCEARHARRPGLTTVVRWQIYCSQCWQESRRNLGKTYRGVEWGASQRLPIGTLPIGICRVGTLSSHSPINVFWPDFAYFSGNTDDLPWWYCSGHSGGKTVSVDFRDESALQSAVLWSTLRWRGGNWSWTS